KKLSLTPLRVLHMPVLDVAEAAHLRGKQSQLDRGVVIAGVNVPEQLFDELLVFRQELTLQLAVLGISKDVERSSTEPLQLRENLEHAHHPRAKWTLASLARHGIRLGQDGWGHVERE